METRIESIRDPFRQTTITITSRELYGSTRQVWNHTTTTATSGGHLGVKSHWPCLKIPSGDAVVTSDLKTAQSGRDIFQLSLLLPFGSVQAKTTQTRLFTISSRIPGLDLAKKLGLQPKELDAEVPDPNHYAALQTSLETLRLLQELYAELPEPTPYVPENLLK
ncbi:hypothetical protein CRG98_040410 [Punica granatum]|uniref:Uncharacterized protein n=1 Tax=Punica granatum TaxID=22663 RepID=A0A2I0I5C9_PUNGR|nr:hypothetical protein CRG98_040410 [Punica granatum]